MKSSSSQDTAANSSAAETPVERRQASLETYPVIVLVLLLAGCAHKAPCPQPTGRTISTCTCYPDGTWSNCS